MLVLRPLPVFLYVRAQIIAQLVLQRLHHPGNRHQHGNAFALDGRNDVGGLKAVLKMHRAAEQRRNKHPHELSKDMAQRQQLKKTDGMKQPLRFSILGKLALDWVYAG